MLHVCCLLALLLCLMTFHEENSLSSELLHARLLSSWVRLSHCVVPTCICLSASVTCRPACCSWLSLSLSFSFSLCCLFDSVWTVHLFSFLLFLALSQPLCWPGFTVSSSVALCRLGCVLAAAEDSMTFKRAVWAATAASVGLNVTSAYWLWSFLALALFFCFVVSILWPQLVPWVAKPLRFLWNTFIQYISSVGHPFHSGFLFFCISVSSADLTRYLSLCPGSSMRTVSPAMMWSSTSLLFTATPSSPWPQ